jgi:hypothetical protein
MRTKLIESNKPEKYIHSVRNVDTSPQGATIAVGSPLVLNLSNVPQPPTYQNGLPAGFEDGLQVVLPGTAGSANSGSFYYGVAAGPIVFNQLGETIVHGVAQAAVFRQSRASTTAVWTAGASAAGFGFPLGLDTVNNCFSVGTAAGSGPIVLVDDLKSYASSASSPGDTRLVLTALSRSFIRQM